MNFHGKAVTATTIDDIDALKITRELFLDKTLQQQVASKIASGDEILFLSNDVNEPTKKSNYHLILHGILPCGSKTTLTINGIEPYVDIRFLTNETEHQVKARLRRLIETIENGYSTKITIHEGKDFLYYDHNSHKYARVHFPSLAVRQYFIEFCSDQGIKTYSNDKSSYYRAIAREYEFNLSSWNTIRNYTRVFNKNSSKAHYNLEIDIRDILPVNDDKELYNYAKDQGFDRNALKYENLIISGFDIEMIPHNLDRFPDADKNPNDSIFMICMTYHFVKKEESILSVCLTLKVTDPIKDVLMIHCASETLLLRAFSRFMYYLQPDLITEFNGGGFDWRNIITKVRYCRILPAFLEDMSIVKLQSWEKNETMLSRFHKENHIKIDGATPFAICKGLKMPGFIGFDTLVVFKQLEPKEDSHRLNECLRRCNLGSKDDLDVKEMFRIYRSGTSAEMALVAHYCFIDTFKLQQLLLKKNVIQDRREVANLSFTSLYDNFFFAGSGRMRNLVLNRGSKRGYFFDTLYRPTIENAKEKFPGAFVVPPKKGIVKPMLRLDEFVKTQKIDHSSDMLVQGFKYIECNFKSVYDSDETSDVNDAPEIVREYMKYTSTNKNHYPISGLDYSSLYPSIIMTYNFSPEKLIIDEAYANEIRDLGHSIQYVEFPFCQKTVKAWFVRHDCKESEYSICGGLLIELFNKRAEIKKKLKHYGEQIYEMENEMKLHINTPSQYPRFEEYNETKFYQMSCDSKQRAVKIFMNTLYGEMGNFLSCICSVETAGSVTTMGRYNLKLAKSFVENDLGMTTYYGDTDSLYIACNPKYFSTYDYEYFTGKVDKIKYATNLVNETFKQIEVAKQLVNNHLFKDNGTRFLKMEYEEVLYPVAFLSKKKYYGVPHEENVDFYPRNLFLKGLEIVKRGNSEVLKNVTNEIIREVIDLRNTRDIMDTIDESIVKVFTTDWPLDAFVKSKVYRPDKNNVPVLKMIKRYRDMNYHSIPEPNVRFKYVMCKYYPWTYNIEGKQTETSTGDHMELIERVKEENLEIDLEYYFDNELTGQLARLITFHDQFKNTVPDIKSPDTSNMCEIEIELIKKEQYKRIEDALFSTARRYISQLAKKHSNAYVNKRSLFVHTWITVRDLISVRSDLKKIHFTPELNIVLRMFKESRITIKDTLMNWVMNTIHSKYRMVLNKEQCCIINTELNKVEKYIIKESIGNILMGCEAVWTRNVVQFIRNEYDYEYICKSNLPYDTVWDVLTRGEMEIILRDSNVFPLISSEQTMAIIDMIASMIAMVLPSKQFM